MTDMKRTTIAIPDELDKKVLELRKNDRFTRCSYSEIIRILVKEGLENMTKNNEIN